MAGEHKITAKSFLAHSNKRSASITAAGFLNQYREFLSTGLIGPLTGPIVAKLDTGNDADTTLSEVQNAVMNHIIALDLLKMEDATEAGAQRGTQKNWLATVYDSEDNICTRINAKGEEEDLVKAFDLSGDADRWADRALEKSEPDCYAIVQHTKLPNVRSIILRQDALARLFKTKRGPVVHQKAVSTKSLGFGVHAKTSRVTFSKG